MKTFRLPALKEHREAKGWTIANLAATAKVGAQTANKADQNQQVTTSTARKLAAALGVPVEVLAGQKGFLDLHE